MSSYYNNIPNDSNSYTDFATNNFVMGISGGVDGGNYNLLITNDLSGNDAYGGIYLGGVYDPSKNEVIGYGGKIDAHPTNGVKITAQSGLLDIYNSNNQSMFKIDNGNKGLVTLGGLQYTDVPGGTKKLTDYSNILNEISDLYPLGVDGAGKVKPHYKLQNDYENFKVEVTRQNNENAQELLSLNAQIISTQDALNNFDTQIAKQVQTQAYALNNTMALINSFNFSRSRLQSVQVPYYSPQDYNNINFVKLSEWTNLSATSKEKTSGIYRLDQTLDGRFTVNFTVDEQDSAKISNITIYATPVGTMDTSFNNAYGSAGYQSKSSNSNGTTSLTFDNKFAVGTDYKISLQIKYNDASGYTAKTYFNDVDASNNSTGLANSTTVKRTMKSLMQYADPTDVMAATGADFKKDKWITVGNITNKFVVGELICLENIPASGETTPVQTQRFYMYPQNSSGLDASTSDSRTYGYSLADGRVNKTTNLYNTFKLKRDYKLLQLNYKLYNINDKDLSGNYEQYNYVLQSNTDSAKWTVVKASGLGNGESANQHLYIISSNSLNDSNPTKVTTVYSGNNRNSITFPHRVVQRITSGGVISLDLSGLSVSDNYNVYAVPLTDAGNFDSANKYYSPSSIKSNSNQLGVSGVVNQISYKIVVVTKNTIAIYNGANNNAVSSLAAGVTVRPNIFNFDNKVVDPSGGYLSFPTSQGNNDAIYVGSTSGTISDLSFVAGQSAGAKAVASDYYNQYYTTPTIKLYSITGTFDMKYAGNIENTTEPQMNITIEALTSRYETNKPSLSGNNSPQPNYWYKTSINSTVNVFYIIGTSDQGIYPSSS